MINFHNTYTRVLRFYPRFVDIWNRSIEHCFLPCLSSCLKEWAHFAGHCAVSLLAHHLGGRGRIIRISRSSGYIVNLRPTCTTGDPILKKKQVKMTTVTKTNEWELLTHLLINLISNIVVFKIKMIHLIHDHSNKT